MLSSTTVTFPTGDFICPTCGSWDANCRCTWTQPVITHPTTYIPSFQIADPRQGWQCPQCRRILAPHVDECLACAPTEFAIEWKPEFSTSSTHADFKWEGEVEFTHAVGKKKKKKKKYY